MMLIPHVGPLLDEIVILIPHCGRNSDTNPAVLTIFEQFLDEIVIQIH